MSNRFWIVQSIVYLSDNMKQRILDVAHTYTGQLLYIEKDRGINNRKSIRVFLNHHLEHVLYAFNVTICWVFGSFSPSLSPLTRSLTWLLFVVALCRYTTLRINVKWQSLRLPISHWDEYSIYFECWMPNFRWLSKTNRKDVFIFPQFTFDWDVWTAYKTECFNEISCFIRPITRTTHRTPIERK